MTNPHYPQLVLCDSSVRSFAVEVHQAKLSRVCKTDDVAEEVPIALVYNGISHVVMLATPQDLEDFALGFSITEGIAQQASELYAIKVCTQTLGITVDIELASAAFASLKQKRRNLTGRTGCGLCGTESLQQVLRMPPVQVVPNTYTLSHDVLQVSLTNLRHMQALQAMTGATHACAWVKLNGEIVLVREDVGRHNALDKLIGALLMQKVSISEGFILTTSRASFEMVSKAAWIGAPLLAAMSAPSALAIRLARYCGMSLLGFVRDSSCVVYCHAQRFKGDAEDAS